MSPLLLLGLHVAGAADPATPPGGIDRFAVYEQHEGPRKLSDAMALGSVGLAAGTAGTLWLRGDGGRPLLAVGASVALTEGLTFGTKALVERRRPYTYGEHDFASETATSTDLASFFSGHTSATASSWFSAAETLRHEGVLDTPGERALVYGLAGTATVATGTLRVLAGRHFPSDVLVGAGVGTGLGFLLPCLVYRSW